METSKNRAALQGVAEGAPRPSHINHGVTYYTFPLAVERLSGAVDTLNVVASEEVLEQCPVAAGEEVALLINGLGATSAEELYILSNSVSKRLEDKGISIYRTFVGEFATSMEMAGASISIMKLDDETRAMLDMPVSTPFYCQK